MTQAQEGGYIAENLYPSGEILFKRSNSAERLVWIVTDAHCCKFQISTGSNRVTIFGKKRDVMTCKLIIAFLHREIERSAFNARARCRYRNSQNHQILGFLAAFRAGAMQKIKHRFEQLRTDVSRDATLVVTEKFFCEYSELRFVDRLPQKPLHSRAGYHAGRSFGIKVPINQGIGAQE